MARQDDFVTRVYPYALDVALTHNVPIEAVLGQAALESNWGQSAPGNNYFGIKGQGQVQPTQEYEGGRMVSKDQSFRAYDSPAHSFQDYSTLLGKDRYQGAVDTNDISQFFRGLKEGGYATDPRYVAKGTGAANAVKGILARIGNAIIPTAGAATLDELPEVDFREAAPASDAIDLNALPEVDFKEPAPPGFDPSVAAPAPGVDEPPPPVQSDPQAYPPKAFKPVGMTLGQGIPAPEPKTSASEAFTLGVGQGATLGFADELAGAIAHAGTQEIDPFTGTPLYPSTPQALPEYTTARDVVRQHWKQAQTEHPYAATAGELTGSAVVPIPVTKAKQGAGIVKKALTTAASPAVTGALYGAGTAEGDWGDTTWQSILGGVGGGVVGGVTAPLITKASAAVRSAMPRVNQLNELAAKHGIDLSVGELRGSGAFQKTEVLLEQLPWIFGIGGFRKRQGEQLRQAALKAVGNPQLTGDVGEEIQASLLRTLDANKKQATQLYDQVGQWVNKLKPGPIAPTGLRDEVNKLLAEYPDLFERLGDTALYSKLSTLAKGTATKPATPIVNAEGKAILDAFGNPLFHPAKEAEISFDDARWIRQRLGEFIGRAKKSAGGVGSEEVRTLSRAYGALEDDIAKWASGNDNKVIRDAYQKANRYYQLNVAPFKQALEKKVTGEGFDTDTIVKAFIKPDRPKLAARLTSKLDVKGQEAVQYAILKDAFDGAWDPHRELFSPAKFAGAIERLGDTHKGVFPAARREELEGLVKLMRVAVRAGQYLENPPTGLRGAQLLAGGAGTYMLGSGAISVTGALASGATAFTLSKLLTSSAGRKILASAKDINDFEPLRQLLTQAVAVTGAKAATPFARPAPEEEPAVSGAAL